ncbi:MAG: serine hydrolase domain-containing protein [Terriglobia bacterium]
MLKTCLSFLKSQTEELSVQTGPTQPNSRGSLSTAPKATRIAVKIALLILLAGLATLDLRAQLPPETASRVDAIVGKALAETNAPSASIAVVKDSKIVYVHAYGNASLDPATPARPEMPYKIGSVSKQFMGMAILLLVQDGKLSLDDPVGRYLPTLTRANDITIRQLLSHTSGYQDFYPLDYVAPFMTQRVTPDEILDRWARKPLDFEPGTQWQYSNTNFVVAGRIVEKVTSTTLMAFLRDRIFRPLGMETPIDLDYQFLADSEPKGYTRFGRGPVRPVQPEAPGWLFGAGELAMTARDLALWDLGLLQGKLLKPALMEEMIKPVILKNGAPTNYALGIGVSNADGHPRLQHGGAVSGYVSSNTVWLDQGAAVVAFSNLDGTDAPGSITRQIGPLLLAATVDPQAAAQLEQARRIFSQLQGGTIDRSLLTSDANSYFTPQVLADAASSLKPLGTPESFEQTNMALRGGMTLRNFQIKFAGGTVLHLSTFSVDDGKFAQYLIQ